MHRKSLKSQYTPGQRPEIQAPAPRLPPNLRLNNARAIRYAPTRSRPEIQAPAPRSPKSPPENMPTPQDAPPPTKPANTPHARRAPPKLSSLTLRLPDRHPPYPPTREQQ